MSMRSMDRLHDFLTSGGRELVNVKFFPGSNRGLNPELLAAAAHSLLSEIMASPVNRPPVSGIPQRSVREALG